jgi:hypothetical protein
LPNRVRVVDKGARDVVRRMGAARGSLALAVGVQGKKGIERHKGSILTVAEIAELHEFGLGVPERSWLRAWFDENQAEIREDIRKVGRGILLGRFTRERGLEILGLKYVGQIQRRIASNIPPPLAPATIAKKGSSVALIDTGQLRSAISYVVEKALEDA